MPLVNPPPPPNLIALGTSTPIKVGGTPGPGSYTSNLASAWNHVHGLVETSGPTNLDLGGIRANEIVRRVSGLLAGMELRFDNTSGNNSTSVVTLSDVSTSLTYTLQASRQYLVIWLFNYSTAAATTGLMLSVNFTGTASTQTRFGLFMATGAATTHSAVSAASATPWDALLGNATVGPGSGGGNTRMGLMYCRISVVTAGDIALRYASGVAASAVTIGGQSVGIVLQQ